MAFATVLRSAAIVRPVAARKQLAAAAPARAARALLAAPRRAARGASIAAAALFGAAPTAATEGIYGFTVTTADGGKQSLSKYKGKVLLIVNVASACGFTPQYTGLAALADKYPNDLVVIAQPCNQFGGQEPGSDKDIATFAKNKGLKRGLILSKADVNGANQTDLYAFLKSKKGGIMGNDVKWNFAKFLVDRQGNVVGRYPSTTAPEAIEADIKKYV